METVKTFYESDFKMLTFESSQESSLLVTSESE